MKELAILKSLIEAHGISGSEQSVAEAIKKWLDPQEYEISQDAVGNLYIKNPGREPAKKIVLDAHMDDVGVRITGVTQEGMLRFHPVGGVDEFTLPGKAVLIGKESVFGVFCIGPDPKSSPLHYRDMFIDIGCVDRASAERLVKIGDEGNFESDFIAFGDGRLKARNFDDRVGCAIMVETLLLKLDVAYTAIFTVREEVGLYGSKVAAPKEKPDVAICLEGGGSGDIPGFDDDDRVSVLGDGPALSVRNEFSVFDVELNRRVMETAKRIGARIQLRRGCAGGCDANSYQQLAGSAAITLAPPTRYIHTHNTVIARSDYEDAKRIVRALIEEFAAGESLREEPVKEEGYYGV
ncbi:M20/M25/M40 family metallo-hydrolase [Christensenellaceae bacterium OttesenSCG-928-M15]|nr:M20/M25/M40 family metallo-hydrolase [Christensenellaceae bacterium OttesenSCG-928-M15]